MSRAKRLRDWLATQASPRTSAEIATATGELRHKVNIAIGDMIRSGALTGSIEYPARYALAKPVRTWRYTDPGEKAAAAIRARAKANANRDAKRHAAAALLAPQREAEWRARVVAKAAIEVERAAVKAAKRAKRTQPKAKRVRQPKAAKPKAATRLRIAPVVIVHPPAAPVAETVAEWQARTGQRPEVLPVRWNQPEGIAA